MSRGTPTCACHHPDHADHAPSGPPPLLRRSDFNDTSKFVTIGPVPLIEAHDDPQLGVVDEPLLRRILHNNRRREQRGLYSSIIRGHTLTPDMCGNMPSEEDQPAVVGYCSDWHLAPDPVNGQPCLWAFEHHLKAHAGDNASYPFRSVERLQSAGKYHDPHADVIDRVSLLRTPPRRELGAVHFHYRRDLADPHDVARVCYSRGGCSRRVVAAPSRNRRLDATGASACVAYARRQGCSFAEAMLALGYRR